MYEKNFLNGQTFWRYNKVPGCKQKNPGRFLVVIDRAAQLKTL